MTDVKYDQQLINIMTDPNRFDTLLNNNIVRFDDNETKFLRRQLTLVQQRVLEAKFPEFTAKSLFPLDTTGGPGLETIEYRERTGTGEAAVVAGKTTDIPLADFSDVGVPCPVRNVGIGYKWSIFDLQKATRAGLPLSDQLARESRRGTEQFLNKVYWGTLPKNKRYGLKGFFTDLTKLIQEPTDGNMLTRTGPENRDQLLDFVRNTAAFTNNAYMPDTLVLPIAQYNRITTQPIADDNNMTVARFIMENTSITRIEPAFELAGVNVTGISNKDCAVCYKNDPDVVELKEPVPYTTMPVQQKGYDFMVPTYSATAGMFIYRKAVGVIIDIGA